MRASVIPWAHLKAALRPGVVNGGVGVAVLEVVTLDRIANGDDKGSGEPIPPHTPGPTDAVALPAGIRREVRPQSPGPPLRTRDVVVAAGMQRKVRHQAARRRRRWERGQEG